jgi:hypothetical protein
VRVRFGIGVRYRFILLGAPLGVLLRSLNGHGGELGSEYK